MARRLVLDANILIRAVLGVRVQHLLEVYNEVAEFFTPSGAFAEAYRHVPSIAAKRGVDPTPLLASLDQLRLIVGSIDPEVTDPLREPALVRIGARDPMDWPVVAAALALECPPQGWCRQDSGREAHP